MAKPPNRMNFAEKIAAELADDPAIKAPRLEERTEDTLPYGAPLRSQDTEPPEPQASASIGTQNLAPPGHPLPNTLNPQDSDAPRQQDGISFGHSVSSDPTTSAPPDPVPSDRNNRSPDNTRTPASQDASSSRQQTPNTPGQQDTGAGLTQSQHGTAEKEEGPSVAAQQASRIGMVRISGFYSEKCKLQLNQLMWKYGRTYEEELLGHALNLLFRWEGLPEIAFDGKESRKKQITLSPPHA